MKISNQFVTALCGFGFCFNMLSAGMFEDHRKKQMIRDLDLIKHNFDVGYAPLAWKKEKISYDLESSYDLARAQIVATPGITTKQFQQIVRQFMCSTKDYHVDVLFYSTEAASLPFSVRGVNGRFFIDWIDPLRLSSKYYQIRVGDELLTFDDLPIEVVMRDMLTVAGKGANLQTDLRLADIKLTHRVGMAGDVVPKGSIMISTRSADTGKVNFSQLHWAYTPEQIFNPLDLLESCGFDFFSPLFGGSSEEQQLEIPELSMESSLYQALSIDTADHAGGMGAEKSFLPELGEVIWTLEDEEERDLSNWQAYVYRHPNGQAIGFIRIPHYHEKSDVADEFGEILNLLETKCDALVIDQLHNFGGFVDYTYKVASMLAIEPLKTPYHRIKITQKEAMNAYQRLEMIKLLDLMLVVNEAEDKKQKDDKKKKDQEKKAPESDDQNKGKDEPKGDDKGDEKEKNKDQNDKEQPKEDDKKKKPKFNYQELLFLKSWYQLILDEWNRGETLTRPTHILGVDRINPHPKYRYTKPILMLIDEMDFSGADFMPAILQDNKRATLFGCRTAGAGGFITAFQFPNTNGIAACFYTGSVAERPNTQKIENVGITPEIEYQLTAEDLQGGYKGYVNAVNDAIQQILVK